MALEMTEKELKMVWIVQVPSASDEYQVRLDDTEWINGGVTETAPSYFLTSAHTACVSLYIRMYCIGPKITETLEFWSPLLKKLHFLDMHLSLTFAFFPPFSLREEKTSQNQIWNPLTLSQGGLRWRPLTFIYQLFLLLMLSHKACLVPQ